MLMCNIVSFLGRPRLELLIQHPTLSLEHINRTSSQPSYSLSALWLSNENYKIYDLRVDRTFISGITCVEICAKYFDTHGTRWATIQEDAHTFLQWLRRGVASTPTHHNTQRWYSITNLTLSTMIQASTRGTMKRKSLQRYISIYNNSCPLPLPIAAYHKSHSVNPGPYVRSTWDV